MKIYKIKSDNYIILLTHIGKLIYCGTFSEKHGIYRSDHRGFLFTPYPIADNCAKIDSGWLLDFDHVHDVDSIVSFDIIDYVINLNTDVNVAVMSHNIKHGFDNVHYHIRLYSNSKTDLEKVRVMLSLEHNIE